MPIKEYGGRGEVVNAPDCGSGIREFDSHRPPQITVKALVFQGFFYRNINLLEKETIMILTKLFKYLNKNKEDVLFEI